MHDINEPHYGFWGCGKKIGSYKMRWDSINYGNNKNINYYYDINDTVGVHLNLIKKELSFSVNGNNKGIAFKIPSDKNIKYRLVVSMFYPGSSVTILKFKTKQK